MKYYTEIVIFVLLLTTQVNGDQCPSNTSNVLLDYETEDCFGTAVQDVVSDELLQLLSGESVTINAIGGPLILEVFSDPPIQINGVEIIAFGASQIDVYEHYISDPNTEHITHHFNPANISDPWFFNHSFCLGTEIIFKYELHIIPDPDPLGIQNVSVTYARSWACKSLIVIDKCPSNTSNVLLNYETQDCFGTSVQDVASDELLMLLSGEPVTINAIGGPLILEVFSDPPIQINDVEIIAIGAIQIDVYEHYISDPNTEHITHHVRPANLTVSDPWFFNQSFCLGTEIIFKYELHILPDTDPLEIQNVSVTYARSTACKSLIDPVNAVLCPHNLIWDNCASDCTATCRNPDPCPCSGCEGRCVCPENWPILHRGWCMKKDRCETQCHPPYRPDMDCTCVPTGECGRKLTCYAGSDMCNEAEDCCCRRCIWHPSCIGL